MYGNCGSYLGKEMRILQPDVIVTQGKWAHEQAERHVFQEGVARLDPEKVRGVDIGASIARIVTLKEDTKCVYWLKSVFPSRRPWVQPLYVSGAGEREKEEPGAKRRNFLLYGRAIRRALAELMGDAPQG